MAAGKTTRTDPRMLVLAGALAAFLAPFLLYLDTLAPTVLFYDSGTLQTKAYVLGIGHPTGYPTFILLGKLFTYLPLGDPAYRVNLSSAVYAALSCLLVYLAALRLILQPRQQDTENGFPEESTADTVATVTPALLAALAFAAGPTLWSQAVVTEVYTLNALLIAATLYALLLWRDSGRSGHLLLAAFLTGLAMTAHMTSGVLLPAALLFVALVKRSVFRRPKLLFGTAGAFLLGLSPYLYLPLRASMDPPMNYGDASTLEGLRFLLTGGNFRGQMWAYSPAELPDRLGMYLELLLAQYTVPLLIVAGFGAVVLALGDRPALALLGAFTLLSLAYALEYSIDDIAVYFVPSYLVVALCLAVGLARLPDLVLKILRQPASLRLAALTLVLLPALALLVPHAANVRAYADRSDDLEARRLVEDVAREAEPGSTIFGGRSLAALQYMQIVEGRRQDLRPITVLKENIFERLDAARKRGPVYLIQTDATYTTALQSAGYRLTPVAKNLYEVSPTK